MFARVFLAPALNLCRVVCMFARVFLTPALNLCRVVCMFVCVFLAPALNLCRVVCMFARVFLAPALNLCRVVCMFARVFLAPALALFQVTLSRDSYLVAWPSVICVFFWLCRVHVFVYVRLTPALDLYHVYVGLQFLPNALEPRPCGGCGEALYCVASRFSN